MDPTRHSSQAGQTLIEVLVTALVVLLISAATATALVSSMHASGDQRLRAQANALASQDQERMRGLSDEQLASLGGSGQSRTATDDGVTFTIKSSATPVNTAGLSSCTGSGAADYHITSTVTWTESPGSATNSVTADSLMALPAAGNLLVSALDETGQPLPGVTVATTSGPSSRTGVTDANGCLVFAGLTAGGYTVQFSKSGYVDSTDNATPTATVPVTAAGTPTKNTVSLGQAGSITATFSGASATSTTTGDADALSYSSTGNAAAIATSETSAATSQSVSSLYPFPYPTGSTSYTGNYTVWGGECYAQEPPQANRTTVTVSPGASATASIAEPQLYVTTTGATGAAVVPTAIKLTFSSTSPSCTDTWSPPIAGGTTVPSTGWLSDPGQPYADGTTGTLTVCASYSTKTGGVTRRYYGSSTTTNANFAAPTVVPVAMKSTTSC